MERTGLVRLKSLGKKKKKYYKKAGDQLSYQSTAGWPKKKIHSPFKKN